jgi:hypothetical protein
VDGEALEGGGLTGDLADRRRPADRDGTQVGLADPEDLDLTQVGLEDPADLEDLDLTQVGLEGLAEGAIASTTVSAE